MRVFVTGWDGLFGGILVPGLSRDHEVKGFGVTDGDVADRDFVEDVVASASPDVVIHLAAMTAVDRCEESPEEAFRVNEAGSRTVARAAAKAGALLVALSTDYVFDGRLDRPYRETDPARPLGVYGQSKLAGEQAIMEEADRWAVIRSAWLYGPGGPNFVDTILGLLHSRETVSVVSDQRGSPTYVPDLADALLVLIRREPQGLYHLANSGNASWFELAREAARLTGLDPDRVLPATTEEIARPAPRPPYSVLDCGRSRRELNLELRPWTEALQAFLESRPDSAPERWSRHGS